MVSAPSAPEMIESRLGWDHELDRYYLSEDRMDKMTALANIQSVAREAVYDAMQKERHSWEDKIEPLSFHVAQAKFLDEDGNERIEFYVGVPKSSVFGANAEERYVSIRNRIGAARYLVEFDL